MSDSRGHVALLVDFANLLQGLRDAGGDAATPPVENGADAHAAAETPAAGALARALAQYAGQLGRVTLARAYADWARLGSAAREVSAARLSPVLVPATEDGEDRSHIQLAVDAMHALFAGDEPEAFVLVTSDPTLLPLVQAIRADGSEVILVSAGSSVSEEMRAEADRFVPVESILAGAEAAPVAAREVRPARPAVEARGRGAPSGRRGEEDEAGARAYRTRAPHPTPMSGEIDFPRYDWRPFVGLIDELEQRLPFVGVRYLVNKVLGPHNCGIDDPRLKRDLINRAVDDGLIEMYPVGNVGDRADPVTACRLDRAHPIVVEVLGPGSRPGPSAEAVPAPPSDIASV
jgi:hypothetical protein